MLRPARALILAVLSVLFLLAVPQTAECSELYLGIVKPLLTEKCVSCHGPVRQEAGLRLDSAKAIARGGDSGEVVDLDDFNRSELLARVGPEHYSPMPPPEEGTPLEPAQVVSLRRWLELGMPAPDDEKVIEGPQDHWAFQPIRRPSLPPAGRDGLNPIDALVEKELSRRGLIRAPRADKETVLRRLTFTLLGLPPTETQRAQYLSIDSPDEERVFVDRLLADPAYAERWARHWMDVWRYSDWNGYKNQLRGSQRHIWRWRDWIIDSLAQDKPYAQMVFEMLAGDEIAPLDPETLRATGFLARNYHHSNRNIWLDATVEHTAKAFCGITLNCARCHDHKYDPISQEEYYRFRAIFEPHQVRTDRVSGVLDTLKDGLPRAYDAELDAETRLFIGGNEKMPDETKAIEPDVPSVLGVSFEVERIDLPLLAYRPGLRDAMVEDRLREARRKIAAAEAAVEAFDGPDDSVQQNRLAVAQAKLHSLEARISADQAKNRLITADYGELSRIASERENALALAEARLRLAGSKAAVAEVKAAANEDKDKASAADLKKARKELADAEAEYQRLEKQDLPAESGSYSPIGEVYPKSSTGRRRALARWITHPENPLTARVAVNHVWMRHFGTPLVANVFDFGLRSERPRHAELLDWLSAEFIRSGWSFKHLHRLIVQSRTFRTASDAPARVHARNASVDPDNESFWRFNVIRLEAEAIRDGMLAAAGALDRRVGGPAIPHRLGEQTMRRSLYFQHAYEKQMKMLTLFDAASPTECYRRSSSILPQQALVLSNSELSRKMAKQLVAIIEREPSKDHPTFIGNAFIRILGRPPTAEETEECLSFLTSDPASEAEHLEQSSEASEETALQKKTRRENLVHVLMNHNDFVVLR